jgi:hypothetical protein
VSTVCSLFTFLWRRILDIAEEPSTVLVLAGRFGNKHAVARLSGMSGGVKHCVPVCYRRLKDTSFPQDKPVRREWGDLAHLLPAYYLPALR